MSRCAKGVHEPSRGVQKSLRDVQESSRRVLELIFARRNAAARTAGPLRKIRRVCDAPIAYDLDTDDALNYFDSLLRRDLDWTVRMRLVYDTLHDQTSFFVRFEPTLRRLRRARHKVASASAIAIGMECPMPIEPTIVSWAR